MNGGSLGEASLLHTSLADCKVTFAKDSFGTLLTKWYSYCLVNVKTSPTLTNIDLTKLAPMPTVDRGGMTFGRCNRHTDVFLTGPSASRRCRAPYRHPKRASISLLSPVRGPHKSPSLLSPTLYGAHLPKEVVIPRSTGTSEADRVRLGRLCGMKSGDLR